MSLPRRSLDSETALSNVKIKVEPGTSTAPTTSLLRNIKTEPGLPSSTTRLTSFRVPRDLTLGGNIKTEKPKKIYTPNINVQRNKKKEDGTPVKTESKHPRGRGRGRGHGDRGRGRGKPSGNLVQSSGVFSQGISEASRSGSRSYGGYRESSDNRREDSFMEKPLLDLNRTVDKAEEEEKLKALLRDDFIDDGTEVHLDDAPVLLPLIDQGKLYKNESKVEPEVTTGQDEIDVKPIILSNGQAVMPEKKPKIKIPSPDVKDESSRPTTIPQLIENQSNGYMLIQFPDCLPGLSSRGDDLDNTPAASEHPSKSQYCTLASLKPGMLGKIQIRKSGEARLIVGDNCMIVDMGSRLSFRQDLVAAKINADNSNGELINLGRINSTLICSPDWESMLASL